MSGAPEPQPGDSTRLGILMLDYSLAREDERTLFNIQAAVTGVAVALLAGIATLVSDTCQLNPHEGCTRPPDVFLAGAPAIPLGVLALLQTIAASSAIRIYYIRALEKEIREHAPGPLTQLAPVGDISPASYMGLLVELTTLRRGRSGYRFLSILIMLIAFFTFGGLTLYIAFKLDGVYKVGMIVGYGASFTVLFSNVAAVTLGARRTFVKVGRRYAARDQAAMFEGADLDASAGRTLYGPAARPRRGGMRL